MKFAVPDKSDLATRKPREKLPEERVGPQNEGEVNGKPKFLSASLSSRIAGGTKLGRAGSCRISKKGVFAKGPALLARNTRFDEIINTAVVTCPFIPGFDEHAATRRMEAAS